MAAVTLAATTCAPALSELDRVRATGKLRMATINSPATYYLSATGPAGFEYDLGRIFAQSVGADLAVHEVKDWQAALAAVQRGDADFAAGLAVTEARRQQLRFTPSYAQSLPKVVVRSGEAQPATLAAIAGSLVVPAHTAIAEWLAREQPALDFIETPESNSEELLHQVAQGRIDATIADATLVAINQRYYPTLRVAHTLDAPQALAWAFPIERGTALFNKAAALLFALRGSDRLRVVTDRHFGHAERLGFVGGQRFGRIVEERLDRWRDDFKAAAEEFGLDWRLLAAMGYQESHWNPDAVSPTGVRGLMMLTQATAKEVGIDDRTDPRASISGGAQYYDYLRGRLPASIQEPDRSWMALAAYNIGLGHLMDARGLLADRGRDPDRWINVRSALSWLTQKSFYEQTQYGSARGGEAVTYVGNIRAYYDILVWMSSNRAKQMPTSPPGPTLPRPSSGPDTGQLGSRALTIDIPTP